MKKILCIDSNNILYRGFYALNNMRNSKQVPIGAIFSFIKTMKKIIKQYAINSIIVIGDSYSKKKKDYPTYKKNRDATPLELTSQRALLLEYLSLTKIPYITIEEFEADDIIMAIVDHHNNKKNNDELYILSGDKDLHIALNAHNTFIINPSSYELYDMKWLQKNYWQDIATSNFYLYYALVGDQSDNIPGVQGIGPKNASKIIEQYKSLEALDSAINTDTLSESISKKIQLQLKDQQAKLHESHFLVLPQNIVFDPSTIQKIESHEFTIDQLAEANTFLMSIECPSLTYSATHTNPSENNQTESSSLTHVKDTFSAHILNTKEDLTELGKILEENNVIALDTETSSGNPQDTLVLGFSICVEPQNSWYIPLYYQKQKHELYDDIIALLERYNTKEKTWLMHNALFDLHALNRINIMIQGSIFDTMIAAHIFKENKIGLKELSSKLLFQKMNSFSEIMQFGNYRTFDEVPLTQSSIYAAADAKQTLLLYQHYTNFLEQERYANEKNILYTIELPLIKVLHHMEQNGIICSRDHLLEEEKKYIEKINSLRTEIKNITAPYDISLNPMSTKQTQHFLYTVLELPHTKQKKTDQLTLSTIEHLHPIVGAIILYRSLLSNISHFTTGLLKYIKNDQKIYTHYQQLVTFTGRITTINPNLQNIPRSNSIYKIRNAFQAKEGNCLVSFDYSQIELRVLAHFSQDPQLIDIFTHNKDMHELTARIIFNKPEPDTISQTERQIAKKINFSILYGQTAFNLAKELQIDMKKAKEYLDAFKSFYAGIFVWKDKIVSQAISVGYVETLLGFKRIIPELQDKNKNILEAGKRIAFNSIIQGTAAEITKKAMIDVYEYVKKNNGIEIKLQIHDELLIEIEKENVENHIKNIKYIMENTINLSIKLEVKYNKSSHWE
jgi:DNA polymerase-1